MKRKWISLFMLYTLSISCNAQIEGYRFYSNLDSIQESGLYKIFLSPIINGSTKIDYSDIRIINDNDKWVPHTLHKAMVNNDKESVKSNLTFSTIGNNKTNSTYLINYKGKAINNFAIKLRNTTAERYCTLSGSDNNQNWYVINDSVLINPSESNTDGLNTFNLNFPKSTFLFYKLNILNGNKDPYEINEIATYKNGDDNLYQNIEPAINPSTTIIQKDSGKISYIKVTQLNQFHFDGIKMELKGSKYFERRMEIYEPKGYESSFANRGKLLQSFTFSNNSDLSFEHPLSNAIDFYILIYNEDNIPLKIESVRTTLKERYIKTYLEKGVAYRLIMDNENATQPSYDISAIKIKDKERIIAIKHVAEFAQLKKVESKNNSTWLLWVSLTVGLAVLLLLTKKMITEVNKKNINDTI